MGTKTPIPMQETKNVKSNHIVIAFFGVPGAMSPTGANQPAGSLPRTITLRRLSVSHHTAGMPGQPQYTTKHHGIHLLSATPFSPLRVVRPGGESCIKTCQVGCIFLLVAYQGFWRSMGSSSRSLALQPAFATSWPHAVSSRMYVPTM